MRARLLIALRLGLVLCLALSTQGLLLMQTTFSLRRDAIAARYCVNKDAPELQCEGGCFLSKQLKERRDKERQHTEGALDVALRLHWFAADRVRLAVPPPRPGPEQAAEHGLGYAEGARLAVFRPPRG